MGATTRKDRTVNKPATNNNGGPQEDGSRVIQLRNQGVKPQPQGRRK